MPIILVVLACLLVWSGPGLAAEPVFPPGSRIGLVPPPDMVPSPGVAGFNNPKTGAAIVALEMAAEAYGPLLASFGEEALKAQGFAAKSREALKVGEVEGLLVSGEQNENGRTVPKAVLVAPDAAMTALVIAQWPAGSDDAVREEMLASLRTVAVRPPLDMKAQLDALPFRFGDTAGFRPVRVMAGNSILLTDGPRDAVPEAEQPIMIIAQSLAPAPPADQRESFARGLLAANTFLKDIVLERSNGFRQDRADWHEIVAKARDGHSGVPVAVLQTIRFKPDGYIRMVGIVRADERDAVMPRFRRVVDSLIPR